MDGIPDCHLHAHLFVFNATFDGVEKRWKAGEFAGTKNDLEYHEAAFHLNLANRLQKLGYAIERRGKGWEIADVSPEVIAKFSRRTAAIEAVAKAAGITNAKQKDQIGARSRNKKEKSLTTSELRRAWEERLTASELAALRKAGHGGRTAPVKQSAAEAVDYAIEQSLARKSVVSRSKLQAMAIRRAIGSGADLASLESALGEAELLVKKTGGKTLVTTQKVLAEERTMIAFAQNGRGRESALNANYRPAAGFLAREQKAAIRHVLQSKDRVISIRGGAGTGKTTLMRRSCRRHRSRRQGGVRLCAVGDCLQEGVARGRLCQRRDRCSAAGGRQIAEAGEESGHLDRRSGPVERARHDGAL